MIIIQKNREMIRELYLELELEAPRFMMVMFLSNPQALLPVRTHQSIQVLTQVLFPINKPDLIYIHRSSSHSDVADSTVSLGVECNCSKLLQWSHCSYHGWVLA